MVVAEAAAAADTTNQSAKRNLFPVNSTIDEVNCEIVIREMERAMNNSAQDVDAYLVDREFEKQCIQVCKDMKC